MAQSPKSDVTRLLMEWSKGSEEALRQLIPMVHGELQRLARRHMLRERPGHTLQPTALVNEAYLRLVDQKEARWESRSHFYSVAASMMRRILVDHARKRLAQKRGGGAEEISFDEAIGTPGAPRPSPLELDDALQKLEAMDFRQSRIVELKFFVGLSIEEIAGLMNLSPATVVRDWRTAKAWLGRELGKR
jgi:RNA polymerase sigma factor (TIGR02999 family)